MSILLKTGDIALSPVFILIAVGVIESVLLIGVVTHYEFGSTAGVVLYSLAMLTAFGALVIAFRR